MHYTYIMYYICSIKIEKQTLKQNDMNTTTQLQALVNYTNQRLANWYLNAKEDYGVIGSANASYSEEHEAIIITATENGQNLEDCKVAYVLNEAKDYAFNVWLELAS